MSNLVSERQFRRIADRVLAVSDGDDTIVSLSDDDGGTLRFANNQVVQHVAVRSPSVSVRVAFGAKVGSASTNRLDDESILNVVRQAEQIAKLAPEDPEYLPPLKPMQYLQTQSYTEATANATPIELAKRTKPVIDKCVRHGLNGAGIMSSGAEARGVAASSGLFGYDATTEARFSLTATADDSSGWTLNAHRNINELDVPVRSTRAIDKALQSQDPRELAPGHYPVILEPAAVAGIFGPVLWGLSARSYFRGNSPFVGKLGSVVLDSRLSLETDPTHKDLLGKRFGREGLATKKQTWIRGGVLKQLYYDRFTAKEHNEQPTSRPGAVVLRFDGPTVSTTDELLAKAERAILVTNFWYIRSVDPTDLTVTGMTRDGTFLVEDGKIVAGLRNFRFHDSPLRCMQLVNAATPPQEAITLERGKMLLPAMQLPDFHFSSVTEF